jgi:acyl carrier protein
VRHLCQNIFHKLDVTFINLNRLKNKVFIFNKLNSKIKDYDIASRVKRIIVDKLGVDENEVVTEASFTNDLGADPLDTVELIMEFEKNLTFKFQDDKQNIATVGQESLT